jgi:hypothetical protein
MFVCLGMLTRWKCKCPCRLVEKLDYFAQSHLQVQNGIQRTPLGLTFVTEWGSCRHAAGVAAIMAVYARGLRTHDAHRAAEMLRFAEQQAWPSALRLTTCVM